MAPKTKAKAKAKSGAKAVDAAQILSIFKAYDTSGDGFIDQKELTEVMKRLDAKTWTEKAVAQLFSSMDSNNDDKVDYDEFMTYISTAKSKDSLMRAGDLASEAAAKAREAGEKKMNVVLDAIFKCYDEDEDGKIERIELLEGEESRVGKIDFGPKERKAVIAWFKEAGAEGTPTSGMFLSKEKWEPAIQDFAAKESGINRNDLVALADYLEESYLKKFEALAEGEKAKRDAAAAKKAESAPAAVPETEPEYPVKCNMKDMDVALMTARKFGKVPLVVTGGQSEVDAFFSYRSNICIDCMVYVNKMFVAKSMSKDDAREEMIGKLKTAMNSSGFCKPLHVRLGKSAFDFKAMCNEKFNEDLFSTKLWTIDRAHKLGYFDEGHKGNLEVADNQKWKDFEVVITSNFTSENYKEHLSDKLPHFDEFAVILINKIE